VVEPGVMKIDPIKIKEITNWLEPTNLKGIQSFLGFCNYCRKFIPNWTKYSKPLIELTKKDVPFEWTTERKEAFKQIKEAFTKEPVLQMFNANKPSRVETDASDYGLGAVLYQENENGEWRPIYYWSRKMIPAELNYDIYDKELLAIVEAFKE
jgi:hypothetical protein